MSPRLQFTTCQAPRRDSMQWAAAFLVWCVIAVVMVGHGALRERLITPRLGEQRAHQLSCLTGSLVVLVVAYLGLPFTGAVEAPGLQLGIGAFWLVLTVAFELVFGHWIAGLSWARILRDYDLVRGRLWLLVLAATFAAPLLAGAVREWHPA